MKLKKRILSVILTVHLVVMAIFSCGAAAPQKDIADVFPAYTLTDADIVKFEKQLQICERMLNRN